MATVSWKVLAEGQVASSLGDIFTAAEETWIKKALFSQTSATPQDLVVYLLKSGSSPREIGRADDMPQGYKLELEGVAMEAGDKIQADTTTAGVVDFVITGGERVP